MTKQKLRENFLDDSEIQFFPMRTPIKVTAALSILVALLALLWSFYPREEKTLKEIPPFVPTHEWQEVLPGQAIPRVDLVKQNYV